MASAPVVLSPGESFTETLSRLSTTNDNGFVEGFGKAGMSVVVAVWGTLPLPQGADSVRPPPTQLVMRRDQATPRAGFAHWSASTTGPPQVESDDTSDAFPARRRCLA
jgi:hypothetical protein